MKKYISIEGNIGAGKTTLINSICKKTDSISFIKEDINRWTNIVPENNLLELFYYDPVKYGYMLQHCVIMNQIKDIKKLGTKDIIVTDRCPESSSKVFAYIMHICGQLTDTELILFNQLKDLLYTKDIHPSLYIYLRCTPEKCLERIKKRGRKAEKDINFNYLEMLHYAHEQWLSHDKTINVHIIDVSEDIDIDVLTDQVLKLIN
jgi:thymidine kinase/deoxynucleoside kinase